MEMSYTKAQREAKKKSMEQKNTNTIQTASKEAVDSPTLQKSMVLKQVVKKDIPLTTMVPCASNVFGVLVYISVKTNERHEWSEYGDVEYIELSELVTMKNSQKSFFTKNWILIDDIDILKFLGVEKYYENALNCDEIDRMLLQGPDVIKKKVSGMTSGMKNTVAFRARKLIEEGKLDSINTVKCLEKVLNIELIEE